MFPIMLVLLIGIRKLLDFVFTRHELKMLDDVFPQTKRKEKMEEEEVRRKSIDNGAFILQDDPDTELRHRKLGLDNVHFQDDNFPDYDEFQEEDAIHIKHKIGNNVAPDILNKN